METKKRNNHMKSIQHPLFGISTRNWIRLVKLNNYIDTNYLDRALFISLGSLVTTPGRLIYKLTYEPKVMKFTMKQDPLFIIGHWRSGTTFLHELLSQDPQFCFVSLWNTLLPNCFPVFEPVKNFFSHFLPKTRPMDNIEVNIDGPYEEEAGIAVLSPWSFFHAFHFPRNAEEQYMKSVHFKGLTQLEKEQWKSMYKNFMKTISYSNQGKRLLLKDPANTGRISTLLELFPNAKFIHIYRNPYEVYLSTIKMRHRVLEKLTLQHGDSQLIEQQVIEYYKCLMNSYFKHKNKIPNGNLFELRYEDLVRNPIKQIEHLYSHLDISQFSYAVDGMKSYLDRKKHYKTNKYSVDKNIINYVKENWNFTISKWNYQPPPIKS